MVIVDVTNASQDLANSGVMRVARRLSFYLQEIREWDLVFVKWDRNRNSYNLLNSNQAHILSSNAGPMSVVIQQMGDQQYGGKVCRLVQESRLSKKSQTVLIMPEVVLDGTMSDRIDWCKGLDVKSLVIFHDLIPISNPDLVSQSVRQQFSTYVDAVVRSDHIVSDSSNSLQCLIEARQSDTLRIDLASSVVWLPAQFSDLPRRSCQLPDQENIVLLCVCTIEPRKNHLSLIEAFRALRSRRPELPICLNLVGNSYAGAEELLQTVKSHAMQDSKIHYLGVLSDQELAEHYMSCAFTVYPSLIEGFGIPIVESLWMGKPCLCHNEGVMSELADKGGCIKVDMRNSSELSCLIEKLVDDPEFYRALTLQISHRSLTDWTDYSDQLRTVIDGVF